MGILDCSFVNVVSYFFRKNDLKGLQFVEEIGMERVLSNLMDASFQIWRIYSDFYRHLRHRRFHHLFLFDQQWNGKRSKNGVLQEMN
jgi:hypothetical protein